MTTFQGKTILITGAGGGFGQEMIRQLLPQGARLLLSDHPAMELQAIVDELRLQLGSKNTGEVLGCLPADLASLNGCDQLWQDCQALTPTLDILINNAGIALVGKHHDVPQERWNKLMHINLLSPMRLTQLVVPQMIQQGAGHIVNISSMAGHIGPQNLSSYAASKFGIRGFGEAIAEELKPHGIRVTQAFPFFTRTPILSSESFGEESPQMPDQGPMIYEPDAVIREVLQGVKKNRLRVFPGAIPKASSFLNRMLPGLMPAIARLSVSRLSKKD